MQGDKKFEEEVLLIMEALQNERGEKELRVYLKPLVHSVVSKFIVENEIHGTSKEELVPAGWKYFEIAIRNYSERLPAMRKGSQDIYDFSEYFTWFIRQGIIEFLEGKV